MGRYMDKTVTVIVTVKSLIHRLTGSQKVPLCFSVTLWKYLMFCNSNFVEVEFW